MGSDPRIEAAVNAMLDEGAAPGNGINGIHSWRCAYPDMYGPCGCVWEVAESALAGADAADREAGIYRVDTRDEATVERVAKALGEQSQPAYESWERNRPRTPGVPASEDGHFVEIPSPGADASTMLIFRAEDGHNSMRPLTWREVTTAVLAALAQEDSE